MLRLRGYNLVTMPAPLAVQYVTTSDGYRIAYGVSGRGSALLFLPGAFYHVQLAWQHPGLQDWLKSLSLSFRLIQMDLRGRGLSDHELDDDVARWDYQRDIEAVVGRLKPERLTIFAASTGVEQAVQYAIRHPDQISALILGTSATTWPTALFDTLPAQDWETFLYSLVPRDRSREERECIVELRKQGDSQRNYLILSRNLYGDPEAYAGMMRGLYAELSRLPIPTMVLHARDYALHYTSTQAGIEKAQMTGARLVMIDGTDVWGDAQQGVAAIEAFLAEVAPEARSGRRLPGEKPTPPFPRSFTALSRRQQEVLTLLAQGKTNREIAETLVLSERTVQRHIADIYQKIGARNRAEATSFALGRSPGE
jgi:pimeloyl-ACP methyl ester carboxylesterase/DNA-binding CsgD family transcriptional regulator